MSYNCKTDRKPMEEWMKGQVDETDPAKCRPCHLTPVAQWYYSELQEQGKPELADRLEKTINESTGSDLDQALTVCREMDTIKASVEAPLRERLEDFDCAVQAFDPNDALIEQAAAEEKS